MRAVWAVRAWTGGCKTLLFMAGALEGGASASGGGGVGGVGGERRGLGMDRNFCFSWQGAGGGGQVRAVRAVRVAGVGHGLEPWQGAAVGAVGRCGR